MAASPRILICDDEPTLRELMRISLPATYSFVEASSAAEAIEAVEASHPDLVLLDVMMPGASGLSALEWIRANPESAETPVIVISAFSAEGDRQAALEAGATGFLKKPFDPGELEILAEELLASRSSR
ncbi:MAG TPA: response regulator [Gaiellaceae bacterium]|jgi:CheY-like chemotaxis protein|nr:response regulator [Gaiellaceae bacterium]